MGNDSQKKNIVQDIMPSKRSIRNVELPSRSQRHQNFEEEHIEKDPFEKKVPIKKISNKKIEPEYEEELNHEEEPPHSSPYSFKYNYDDKPKSSKKTIYIVSLLFLLAVAFGISALFKSAKITVTPRNEAHLIDSTTVFTAKKNDTTSNLGFQIVTVSKDLEKTVASDGESQVSKKATGRIVIYNNFSSASQKLVATTRFQTSTGLIYRLDSATTVPGTQTKDGKTIPGSIEVSVTADQPGDKYNIDLVDFTIPGLKGSTKFDKITAKSKTAMSGGFVGMQKNVSSVALSSADDELQKSLRDKLSSDITLQIPDNFVLYPNTITYSFSAVEQVNSNTDGAILKKRGTASAIIFDKGSLTRVLSAKLIPDAKDDLVKITNLEQLTFAFKDNKIPDINAASIDFTLSGNAQFVWVFDESKLKTDISGLSKSQARTLLGTYKSIKEAWVVTNPFWNQKVTDNIDKIQIINTLDQ